MKTLEKYLKRKKIIIRNRLITVNYFYRPGSAGLIIFIPGLGCLKEEYSGAFQSGLLKRFALLVFDWPQEQLNLRDIAYITHQIAGGYAKKYIIVSHSAGGAAGLLCIKEKPQNVVGFVNIEGSLIADNARWSRKIVKMGIKSLREKNFGSLVRSLQTSKNPGFRNYGKELAGISIKSYFSYSRSHARYVQGERLLNQYIKLNIPKIFIYGIQNKSWKNTIKKLKEGKCAVANIPKSHHFPHIDNPRYFYNFIYKFARKIFISSTGV